ncbi:MAG: ATP-binding protein [Boseongicola sp. SB0677_bin_26]|nr:ATP-binding protein [Boseongicola sp. SB0665_bin_10]MYG25487.1 ATP-binding protein [Boseongicola sp. SB0677_bin_26]
MSPKWRFYGRGEQLARLDGLLDWSLFQSVRVHGRRRVGKTELLTEAFSRRSGPPPLVMVELPAPPKGTPGLALSLLEEAASEAGVAVAEQRKRHRYPSMRFEALLREIVYSGAAVVLDEFHNARELGLESAVKLVIDRVPIDGSSPMGGPCGKLFLTGSHQQRIMAMLRDDQPLYGRIGEGIRLRQWSLRTVLEMAGEQGFLNHPSKFLTMHTAFGGMPSIWKSFSRGRSPERELDAWEGDGAWRRAFIDWTARYLAEEPMDQWDNAQFIELSPENRAVLDEIASTNGGKTAAQIRGLLNMSNEDVRRALKTLSEHLEFVTPSWNFFANEARWCLSDNSTLFQVRVLGDSLAPNRSKPGAAARVEKRLESIEGPTFERMAASWLKETEGVTWHGCGVWLPGLADIDVMAVQEGSDGETLIMGGCKRNPEAHHPARLERQFEEFLEAGTKDKDLMGLRALPRRQLLVSPEFTPEARERYAGSGFECVDILDMARALGVDVNPDPAENAGMEAASDIPDPCKPPSPFD